MVKRPILWPSAKLGFPREEVAQCMLSSTSSLISESRLWRHAGGGLARLGVRLPSELPVLPSLHYASK